MRHLVKIENIALQELSDSYDKKFETKISGSPQEHNYKGNVSLNLLSKKGIHDLHSGLRMKFPSRICIRNYKDYVVLEINIDLSKVIIVSLIFGSIIALILSFQTPIKFSAISGGAVAIATYAFLYFRAEKGLELYGKSISGV